MNNKRMVFAGWSLTVVSCAITLYTLLSPGFPYVDQVVKFLVAWRVIILILSIFTAVTGIICLAKFSAVMGDSSLVKEFRKEQSDTLEAKENGLLVKTISNLLWFASIVIVNTFLVIYEHPIMAAVSVFVSIVLKAADVGLVKAVKDFGDKYGLVAKES